MKEHTNEEIYLELQPLERKAVYSFSRKNHRYNRGSDKLVNGLYEDMESQASFILWDLIVKELVNLSTPKHEVQYRLMQNLKNWSIGDTGVVRVPKRVIKGQWRYFKTLGALEFSKALQELDVAPESILEVEDHPVLYKLEEECQQAVRAFQDYTTTLSRKPYEQFVRHILNHVTSVEGDEDDSGLKFGFVMHNYF